MLAMLDALVAERRCTDPGATRQDLLRKGVDRYLAAEKKVRAMRSGQHREKYSNIYYRLNKR
jgi:hypothetical protein